MYSQQARHRVVIGLRSAMVLSVALSSLALSVGVMAQPMSQNEFKAARNDLAAKFKAAHENCAPLAKKARDLCIAEAEGNDKIARAQLDERYKPSARNRWASASLMVRSSSTTRAVREVMPRP